MFASLLTSTVEQQKSLCLLAVACGTLLKEVVKTKTDLQVSSGFGLSDAHNVALPSVQ